MNLTLESLLILDMIDRKGSFAAAAVALDRVPSALTYSVRKLEDDLDVLLFDRRGHRAQLTPAGLQLLQEGRHLLLAANDLEQRVKRTATGRCTQASPCSSSFGVHISQNASKTIAKSSCPNSRATSAASSGETPGLKRRSSTVGSDHPVG